MIVLFTDYGWHGPYVGQLHLAAARHAPGIAVIDLLHDAPRFNPQASAYLLAALWPFLPEDAVVAAVVDPGVGGPRPALVAQSARRFFVGPGNGLAAIVLKRAAAARLWQLAPPRDAVSASFHGRDIFVPAAAQIAAGARPGAEIAARESPTSQMTGAQWPEDLAEIIYIDGFGNAMTGLRADAVLQVATPRGLLRPPRARRFGDVPRGAALVYENSLGLLEIAVNQGRADEALALNIGSPVTLLT